MWSQIFSGLIRITSYGACLVEKIFVLGSTDDKTGSKEGGLPPFSTG